MRGTVTRTLAALAFALAPVSSAWAVNSAIVALGHLDDFVFPAAQFVMEMSVKLDDVFIYSCNTLLFEYRFTPRS